ncbi:hypothetical protein ACFQ6N_39225 [Kitasatospora sp. NPDC056446]|uniref:hypothetical protein n=1 Tax=Kitasatospora sp. NPDC056446 TaxID=3345819 RepID=UPI00369AAEA3
MRREVQAFVTGGVLPDRDADEGGIDRRGQQLQAISRPVTAAEAQALATCFGPDDCYGLAWSLLHLIETGPNPVLTEKPGPAANEWRHRLWQRALNAGLVREDSTSRCREVSG